jgi:hypothetical protein
LRCCFSISFTRRADGGGQLQHRDGHVLPPFVGLDFLNQRHLRRTIGMADFSSSNPAIAFTWSRSRSKAGLGLATAPAAG